MRTIDTDIIEEILLINNKLLKFAENNIFKDSTLTPSQFNILWETILHKSINISNLKKKLIITAPALSQMINRMEKSGFIERSLDIQDKRWINIKATEKWINIYNKLNKKYLMVAEEKFWVLGENEKKDILTKLKYINNIIL